MRLDYFSHSITMETLSRGETAKINRIDYSTSSHSQPMDIFPSTGVCSIPYILAVLYGVGVNSSIVVLSNGIFRSKQTVQVESCVKALPLALQRALSVSVPNQ